MCPTPRLDNAAFTAYDAPPSKAKQSRDDGGVFAGGGGDWTALAATLAGEGPTPHLDDAAFTANNAPSIQSQAESEDGGKHPRTAPMSSAETGQRRRGKVLPCV